VIADGVVGQAAMHKADERLVALGWSEISTVVEPGGSVTLLLHPKVKTTSPSGDFDVLPRRLELTGDEHR